MSKLYNERDVMAQGEHYIKHVSAMTSEDLHSKVDIAAELAHRDIEIERLKNELSLIQQSRELSFQQLEMNGVPRDRARTVHNGIDVLVTRMQREINDLKRDLLEHLGEENCPVQYYRVNSEGPTYAVYGTSSINLANRLMEELVLRSNEVSLQKVDIDSLQKQVDDMTRAPLSEDEIVELWQTRMRVGNRGFVPFARAIEKAHGIVEVDVGEYQLQPGDVVVSGPEACSTCDGLTTAHRVGCPIGEACDASIHEINAPTLQDIYTHDVGIHNTDRTYIITHAEAGIYLGNTMGLGFWTKWDCAGQTAAVTFDTMELAMAHIGTWHNHPGDEKYEFKFVTPDDEGYVTFDALRKQGFGDMLPPEENTNTSDKQ